MAALTLGSLVSTLETSPNKLNTLEELKTLLSSISSFELRNALPNVSIVPVFDCLNTEDKTQLEVCCAVLDKLLLALSPDLIFENLLEEFKRWIHHGGLPVQTLCLSQLLRASQDSSELLAQCTDLLVGVAEQLGHEHQHVALMAANIIVNLGGSTVGLETIYSGDVFEMLQQIMSKDDTLRYRVYKLVVELSLISPEALDASSRCGLLLKLVNEIYTDDILLQLNCLELLSDLAQSAHGLDFLNQQGVITKLEEMMMHAESLPMGAYLLPGLMKFFGGLARFHPKEVLNHFHNFVGLVFSSICHADQSIRGLAIDTVGFIGSTPEGKLALDKQGNIMIECMVNVGNVVRNSPSDLRVKALDCIANLMKLQVADQTDELLQVTEKWFSRLCPNPFDVVWSIAKQPFFDLRIAALHVLQNLAYVPWGQHLMNNAAGFKEYLLDRSMETLKEGKQAKFEVLKVLAESPSFIDSFGRPYYVQVMEFYRQGPFYIQAQSEIAFEEET